MGKPIIKPKPISFQQGKILDFPTAYYALFTAP